MNEAYTGRQVPFEVAVAEAQAIVVGELLKPGRVHMGAPGQSYYDGAAIKVVETLSGKVQQELTITYTCQTIPETHAEAKPREGELYLFFLTPRTDGTWKANKIDVPSPDNKAKVKKLLGVGASGLSVKP